MENRITQKYFKIGQIVTCVKNSSNYDNMTIGKEYKIRDLDYHFPYSICVNDDRKNGGFFPIEIFVDEIKELRHKKINEILK